MDFSHRALSNYWVILTRRTTLLNLASAHRVRAPNSYLGRLLDHKSASAYAIHLCCSTVPAGRYEAQVTKSIEDGGIGMRERKLRKGRELRIAKLGGGRGKRRIAAWHHWRKAADTGIPADPKIGLAQPARSQRSTRPSTGSMGSA